MKWIKLSMLLYSVVKIFFSVSCYYNKNYTKLIIQTLIKLLNNKKPR